MSVQIVIETDLLENGKTIRNAVIDPSEFSTGLKEIHGDVEIVDDKVVIFVKKLIIVKDHKLYISYNEEDQKPSFIADPPRSNERFKPLDFEDIFPLKKHKGKTVIEVLKSDIEYLQWAVGNTSIKFTEKVLACIKDRTLIDQYSKPKPDDDLPF